MVEQNISFSSLGIAPQLLQIIEDLNFKTPTPIQHKAIPPALDGNDMIGIAQTGTGKTMAFAIPMVQRLNSGSGVGLVITPTRELANQVKDSIETITVPLKMKTALLIGGMSMGDQIRQLSKKPQVIIATPGRLVDLMSQRKVAMSRVNILVLDEADRMLDMGFAPQVEEILKSVPKERQTLLFSATMPRQIVALASKFMRFPLQVEVAPSGTRAENVTHELFIIQREHKLDLLGKLLTQSRGSVLLFCRTKMKVSRTVRSLKKMGHSVAEIHSDRTQGQRRQALEGFRSGRYRILAATDIAARGLDINGLELVINFDLPDETENYIHRIGRTGRAGNAGHAISFACPDERNSVSAIEQLIRDTLPRGQHPDVPSVEFNKPKTIASYSRFGSQRRRRRR